MSWTNTEGADHVWIEDDPDNPQVTRNVDDYAKWGLTQTNNMRGGEEGPQRDESGFSPGVEGVLRSRGIDPIGAFGIFGPNDVTPGWQVPGGDPKVMYLPVGDLAQNYNWLPPEQLAQLQSQMVNGMLPVQTVTALAQSSPYKYGNQSGDGLGGLTDALSGWMDNGGLVNLLSTMFVGGALGGAFSGAAEGSGLGTAAEVVNDGTWMEDLLGPPQSPAPPSSLMQQLVDAGVPFDLAKYLPSEASLVKTLIQQGLKLANSDGSGSSSTARPQVGGLPNYSGGSTNSGGDSSSGVSGSLGNPFPDAPTGGASPIKAYLQPTGVSTGAPSQSNMYAGLDPKLVNILSQRAAHGGQIHPRLQQVLSDRGYEINPAYEANPVEMVAGPEDRYYARHAKRGFAVNGKGTGQSDDIPTMLADGEYVFDSDTVSALGDGSSKAGAAALDKMREEIRKHKRSAPVDKIPPKAKSPLDYLVRKGNKHG